MKERLRFSVLNAGFHPVLVQQNDAVLHDVVDEAEIVFSGVKPWVFRKTISQR